MSIFTSEENDSPTVGMRAAAWLRTLRLGLSKTLLPRGEYVGADGVAYVTKGEFYRRWREQSESHARQQEAEAAAARDALIARLARALVVPKRHVMPFALLVFAKVVDEGSACRADIVGLRQDLS